MSEPQRRAAVLVVDDEPTNRKLLRACLESKYEVHEAAAAVRALELLAEEAIDLVLLDVMMPGMGGLELCRRIKAECSGYLPLILLTALGRQNDRNAGLQAGADDFLSKPFDRHELTLRVAAFIKLRQQDQHIRSQLEALRTQEQVIKRQVEELRAVDALKDDLVALLVHDIRNPLTSVAGYLGVLAEHRSEQVRSDAAVALEASERVHEILDDLLCVRMLEGGSLALCRERVSAETVARDAISTLRGAARAREVELSSLDAGADHWIEADAKLLRRAIENLLSNAIKYSPDGGTVRIVVRGSAEQVEFEIGDRGCGIPDEFQQRVFEKFATIEASRGEARRGVGLGLYLVSLVATAHGGRASVRNRRRGGAAFSISLPASQ